MSSIGCRHTQGHVAFDVLHNNDRVVDNNTDGQHETEQGEIVDRDSEQGQDYETAEEEDTGIATTGISVARQFCRKT